MSSFAQPRSTSPFFRPPGQPETGPGGARGRGPGLRGRLPGHRGGAWPVADVAGGGFPVPGTESMHFLFWFLVVFLFFSRERERETEPSDGWFRI